MQKKPLFEILPHDRLLSLKLKDVWEYRDLLLLFVRRDFVAVYKQTILGPLWFFIQPVLSSLVFYIVFNKFGKIPTDGVPPYLFYLAGLTAWNYFSTCLTSTSNVFVGNASIFGKVYFPRLVTPLSIVMSNLIKFGIQLSLFIGFYAYYWLSGANLSLGWELFLLPYLILLMAGLGLGAGLVFSSLTTKYRDLTFLLTFGVQLFMYATPIIYPLSEIPAKYQMYIQLNPLTGVVETFKTAFFDTTAVNWFMIGYSSLFMLILLFVGIVIFNRTEKNFMDTV